jgi:hypothetical protein
VCAPSPTSTASSLASSPITPASPVSRRRWHITEGRGLRKPLRDPREWFARNPDVGHCHYVVDDDLSLLEGLDGDLGTMPEVGSQNAPIDLTADAKPAALAAVKPKPMVFSFYDGRRESYSAKALYDVPSPRPCRWLPTSEHIFGYVESAGDDAETVKSRVTAMATEMAKARAGKGKGKAKATGMDGEEENASAPLPGAVTFMVYTAADRDYINKGVAPSGGRGGTKKRSGSEATGKSSKRRKSKSSA